MLFIIPNYSRMQYGCESKTGCERANCFFLLSVYYPFTVNLLFVIYYVFVICLLILSAWVKDSHPERIWSFRKSAIFQKADFCTVWAWAPSGMLLSEQTCNACIYIQKNVKKERQYTVLQIKPKYVFVLLSRESKQKIWSSLLNF